MRLLGKTEVEHAWTEKMVRVGVDEAPPFDFWPYVEQIPLGDYQGYDCSKGSVEASWRTDSSTFEHVHISTKEDKDVFMVVILDLVAKTVHGHYLLDLKREYGLR